MAGNNGGPWGGGGNRGGDDDNGGGRGPGRRPGGDPQIPEIDEIVRKGQEQLKVLMGGRGGTNGRGPGGRGGGGPIFTRGSVSVGILAILGVWFWLSFYTVAPEEKGVELFLGEYYRTTDAGPHLAPWPLITAEVIATTTERSEDIGVTRSGSRSGDVGLMLTTDENIVDIDFQVVWNINDPAKFLFNLRDGEQTVRAVSESAMREIVAGSELAPILNRDRAAIATEAEELIQSTLDGYDAGINVVRVNLDKADPPGDVIDAFRDVQAAEQERDRLQREADAYANRALAGARGEAAQILEDAEAYRARVVNEAEGEASRFSAVLEEYTKAPEVTRKRLYLETMEQVLGRVDKVIVDDTGAGTQGVVPYLPLNELNRNRSASGGTN
ncbi:MAG: FtsH protease activity modulator HflK [Pseudomonadota bacterium]